jgi:hypothetical protein
LRTWLLRRRERRGWRDWWEVGLFTGRGGVWGAGMCQSTCDVLGEFCAVIGEPLRGSGRRDVAPPACSGLCSRPQGRSCERRYASWRPRLWGDGDRRARVGMFLACQTAFLRTQPRRAGREWLAGPAQPKRREDGRSRMLRRPPLLAMWSSLRFDGLRGSRSKMRPSLNSTSYLHSFRFLRT